MILNLFITYTLTTFKHQSCLKINICHLLNVKHYLNGRVNVQRKSAILIFKQNF